MQYSFSLLAILAIAAPDLGSAAYSNVRQMPVHSSLEATAEPKYQVNMATTSARAIRGSMAASLSTPWIIGICVAVVVVLAGVGGFFMYKRKKAAAEAEESKAKEADSEAATPLLAGTVDQPKAKKADVDPGTMLKLLVQGAMQKIGPKLAKGQAVRNVLENSMNNFAAKSKSFVVSELNCTAANLLKACEAEEAMLLLDLNQAVEANFPPAGALLAGALSPLIITLRLIQHVMQPFALIVPAAVGIWAIILDKQTYCAVPTIHWWLIAQTVVATTLVVAHLLMFAKIRSGQRQMQEKAAQTVDKVGKAEGSSEMSVTHVRDIFVNYSVLLQEALIIENDVRRCIWNKVIGLGTMAWLIIAIWNLTLIAGWTFMPGKVAFHHSAEETAGEDFCGAWRTVFALRLSVIIQVLFFFINIFVAISYGADSMVDNPKYSETLLKNAKKMDDGHAGIPIVQLLVKGILLRGSTDTVTARYNVHRDEQARLNRDKYELQKQMDALEANLKAVDAKVEALRPQIEDDVGDIEEQIKNLQEHSFNMDDWKSTGQKSIEDVQAHAAKVEQATTEAIEQLIHKITELAATMQGSAAGAMMAEKLEQLKHAKALQQAMQAAGEQMNKMPDMATIQAAAKDAGVSVEQMQAMAAQMQTPEGQAALRAHAQQAASQAQATAADLQTKAKGLANKK